MQVLNAIPSVVIMLASQKYTTSLQQVIPAGLQKCKLFIKYWVSFSFSKQLNY